MSAPIVQAVYPDAELVVRAVHRQMAGTTPGLRVVTMLPQGWAPPIIQVNRVGGGADQWDVTDFALVRVAYYGVDRMAAWSLAGQGEGLMIGHRHRSVLVEEYGGGVLLDSVEMVVGGQQLPDVDPEDRRVVKDYLIGCRRQYHLLES